MAVDPSVRIDIAAEFTGKNAFKQADTATAKLMKSVKSLAGGLGIAFGTKAVINFGKQAVKAFSEDEAAALRLSSAVDNLGIGFANVDISKFIADLERSAGIADDILRPAFQGLLTTTSSLVQSQKLLNDAITISRASGIDLATVSQDLAKGYVGITKGLAKYNTGLTKAELSSKSFNEILGTLLKQSAGAADAYLGTTAYSMDVLSVATSNASEIIGGGLIDAFAAVGGGSEASDAAYVIETIATAIANVTRAAGGAVGAIPTLIKNLKNLPKDIFLGFAGAQAGVKLTPKPKVTKTPSEVSKEEQAKRLAKLEADAAKRAKALEVLQGKQLANTKKQAELEKKRLLAEKAKAALSKAAAVFDLTKIQIAAALKATYDKDERLRLLAMQAIEDDNGEAALKYIEQLKLLTAEQQTNKLAGIKTISETELNYINQLLLDELQRIKTTKMSEEEAAAARAAAYAKYNAAIIASGGLAVANFYTEKTQIELLAIAKLAALDTVAAAQATIDILNYTSQTDIIARVAAAQLLADETKAKALSDYLKGYDAGIAAIATSQTLTDAEKLAALTTYLNTASAAITALGGSQKTIDDAKMAALKAYLAEATKPITQVITIKYDVIGAPPTAVIPGAPPLIPDLPGTNTGPKFGVGGQPIWENGMSPGYNTGQGTGSVDNSVTIVVEGNVLDGDDFTDKVNDALLDSIRKGRSQYPAGFIPG